MRPRHLVLALAAAGCSATKSGTPAGTLGTRGDSAGVEIVEHPAGFEESLPLWVVDSTPLLDLGGTNAPGHDFHWVAGAVRLSDGRIVVIDRGTSELRFFDSTGRFLSASGRSGQGPGEFVLLATIQILPGDTIVAIDGQLRRASFLAPDGQFVRSVSIAFPRQRGYASAPYVLADGRLLGEDRAFQEMRETSGPIRRDSFAVILATRADGPVDTVAVVPDYESYPALLYEGGHGYPSVQFVEFGRSTEYVTDGERIFVGTNEPGGIRVFDGGGRLLRIIRSSIAPEAVTEEHRKRRRQETLNRYDLQTGASEAIKAEWRKNFSTVRFATVFPDYERLLAGTDGSLWVERPRHYADEGRRILVYDSAGRAIARVSCPARMRPYVVGPDRIIGMWRDADEVEHVRVYGVGR